ncbi:DUF4183 domain-containing protein [Neobacillus thermocopriae]|uniref:DUF4183 domain-containing protein n=1 Tax=Neobacillus thermocopriae TaxID=1215031 RepID=UPI001969EB6A|nr:DUF4183 domain-containing protein [Neobacillus thermocopriae]MED3623156.1 DUF4183 domain-containing protein [Neobacillus thermocopriae]MED3715051.1 DUF4183 domain-containing protein [Neobacillus thermocopriae]
MAKKVCNRPPRKIEVFEFYAISDGCSRIYKENDGVNEIGKQQIPDPMKVSYNNLFINGVLQPKEMYEVEKGEIRLKSEDIPIIGVPIMLQMFKF